MRHVHLVFLALVALAPGAAAPATAAAPAPAPVTVRVSAAVGEPVNINTADVPELMRLQGVGRTVAERIVEYRKQHGPFKRAEELRRVQGIGKGLWERNRARIVVE